MAKLGFQIMMMMIPPLLALEAYLIMASYMSPESLSAFFILRNLYIFLREIPIAYMWICVSLTGICIGSGRIEQAKRYYLSIQFTAAFITVLEIILMITPRSLIQSMFSNQPEVIAILRNTWLMFTLTLACATPQVIMASFLRGAEKPLIGAIIETTTSIFVGLPFGYYLAFNRGWGVKGLWAGMLTNQVLNFVFFQTAISNIDWPATVQKSLERREQEKQSAKELLKQESVEILADAASEEYLRFEASEKSGRVECDDKFIRENVNSSRESTTST